MIRAGSRIGQSSYHTFFVSEGATPTMISPNDQGFLYAFPGQGLLDFVRQLLARVMRSWPGQLVSRIHPPLCL